MPAVLMAVPLFALSQAAPQILALAITGRPELAPVVQINGHSYVEIEALARVANGSLGFKGNQIILTLPASSSNPASSSSSITEPVNQGFSREFLREGIEEMAAVREWRSVLTQAVQHGYPVSEEWLNGYRAQAAKSLTLASVATSTESDQNALRLLTDELDNMQRLSDKILDMHKSMDYISPDALSADPMDRRILDCAHSLASMAAGGQFQDDASCH
jgi:hypothetical protein